MAEAVLSLIIYAITHVLFWLASSLISWVIKEMYALYGSVAVMHDWFGQPWAVYMTHLVQGIAGAVLGLRVAWDATNLYIARSSGGGGDPTGLLIRAVRAAVGIFAVPLLAQNLLSFSNLAVQAVASAPFPAPNMSVVTQALSPTTAIGEVAETVLSPLLILGIGLLLLLVVIQAIVRAIELLMLGIIGPALALGWASPNEGTGAALWLHMVLLGTTQAAQAVMFYVVIALTVEPGLNANPILYLLTILAAAWTAFKTPAFLHELTHHTGVGQAAGNAASTVLRAVARRFVPGV